MELLNSGSASKKPDATLSTLRASNQKLTIFFIFFFVFLFLITATLVIYLVLDISAESRERRDSIDLESQIHPTTIADLKQTLALRLQTAAGQLQNATSFIESVPISDANNLQSFVFGNCSTLLREGLSQIQYVLEDQGSLLQTKIETAKWNLNACLEDLEMVGSAAATRAIPKVVEASESVRWSGQIMAMIEYNNERNLQKNKYWSNRIDWGNIFTVENVFMGSLAVMQLSFIGFLFWNVYRFS